MMACNGPPQVTDDQELVKPSKSSITLPQPIVLIPNRGLMNAGELSLLVLHWLAARILWQHNLPLFWPASEL